MYVKKSKHGIRIFHSTSDEPMHDGYLKTDDDIRRVLILQKLSHFYQDVIKIDVDVLSGSSVKNYHSQNPEAGLEKLIKCLKTNTVKKEAKSVLKKLKIKL